MKHYAGSKAALGILCSVIVIAAMIMVHNLYKSGCAVRNEEDAISIAKVSFAQIYGEEKSGLTFRAERDRWNGTWHVYGLLPNGTDSETAGVTMVVGGTPEAIISERTGEVMRVWHGK